VFKKKHAWRNLGLLVSAGLTTATLSGCSGLVDDLNDQLQEDDSGVYYDPYCVNEDGDEWCD
jgi:uncharacterized protein YceK